MLLRFAVSNYRSIRSEQSISLIASKLKSGRDPIPLSFGKDIPAVLPCAIIYGPNASGKTNLLKAIQYVRSAVLYSHSRGDPEGGVPRNPFGLGVDDLERPTCIEIDFVSDGIRYNFGFEATSDAFVSEWLYSFPQNRRRKLYEREGQSVSFGAELKGSKQLIAEFMRPNSLFISTATQNHHEVLSNIADFFRDIFYSSAISVAESSIKKSLQDDDIDDRVIKFLAGIDTGINCFEKVEVDVPDEVRNLYSSFATMARKHLGEDVQFGGEIERNPKTDIQIKLGHESDTGETVYFDLDLESAGTRRLLFLMNMVFKAVDNGGVVVIDELDASLHTLAVEKIIQLFADPALNKKNAQLIATTHDTNLLGSKFLRRDEIWFVEKGRVGDSNYYSLAEVKTRPEDNFERGYLQGRYGAVPFSGSAANLFEVE